MKKVHILFPGSFSPYTDGHYTLLKRYIEWAESQFGADGFDVYIIKSPNPRAGLNPDNMKAFIKTVYSNDKRVKVVQSKKSGPIKACYAVLHRCNGTFIFVRSVKDEDDAAAQFIKDFSKGGKYERRGVTVLSPDIDCNPLLYSEGPHKDEPVSATQVRLDAKDRDFEKFRTSYAVMTDECPSVSDNVIKRLFDLVCGQVQDEDA